VIYSLIGKTVEQGGFTGVCRFDHSLRRVFPEMRSITTVFTLNVDDVAIADNHLSKQVPHDVRTVVVHHGCAKTHFERDAAWRNPRTQHIVEEQREMFLLPNRTYVAPSWWVGQQFMFVCPRGSDYSCRVIPHWVEVIEPMAKPKRPVIIGDWRDYNKGAAMWRRLKMACPQWDFVPLSFRDDQEKCRQYGEASLYLCLSLSEGGSYSMCDAESASLPIVTTDVGNYMEFSDCAVIRWQDRDNVDLVAKVIETKLEAGRVRPSFYQDYTFETWREKWEAALQ
jgi:hypothetical protein